MRPVPAVDELVRRGLDAGLDEVGVASADPFVPHRAAIEERKAAGLHGGMHFTYGRPDRSTDPGATLAGARALVVGARSYARRPPPGTGPHRARVAAYQWGDHYDRLRHGLAEMAAVLSAGGWEAVVLADDNRLVDRAAAERAGLGWFGRNTMLLTPRRGSSVVLGAVLTDAPLPPAERVVPPSCGPCRRCLPACPTGALADGVLDARRCLAWLVQADGIFPREHRVALDDRLYGCDDCQDACPPNRRVLAGPSVATATADEATVDVVALLGLDDDRLMARFGHWYVPRRRPAYLRRNALVVLANIGDPADGAVASAVDVHLGHAEPMVVAHAVWAARRLGLDHLLASVAHPTHPDVAAELRLSVERRTPA